MYTMQPVNYASNEPRPPSTQSDLVSSDSETSSQADSPNGSKLQTVHRYDSLLILCRFFMEDGAGGNILIGYSVLPIPGKLSQIMSILVYYLPNRYPILVQLTHYHWDLLARQLLNDSTQDLMPGESSRQLQVRLFSFVSIVIHIYTYIHTYIHTSHHITLHYIT